MLCISLVSLLCCLFDIGPSDWFLDLFPLPILWSRLIDVITIKPICRHAHISQTRGQLATGVLHCLSVALKEAPAQSVVAHACAARATGYLWISRKKHAHAHTSLRHVERIGGLPEVLGRLQGPKPLLYPLKGMAWKAIGIGGGPAHAELARPPATAVRA